MIGSNMKTILITGINGFLGSHLAKKLYCDYKVIGLERDVENLSRLPHFKIEVFSSESDLDSLFKKFKFDAVIHTAVVYNKKEESVFELINTNIVLPVKLLELCNAHNCGLFINTDSFFNRTNTSYTYLREYTLSKENALSWLNLLNISSKLVNMKIFHVYGPYDSPTKFVPWLINSLKENPEEIDFTEGQQIRDFIYIEDVVEAFHIVLRNSSIFQKYTEFEVGTGKPTSIREFVEKAKEIVKSTSILKFGALKYRDNEIMKAIGNPTDLEKLGWVAKYCIHEGIAKINNS